MNTKVISTMILKRVHYPSARNQLTNTIHSYHHTSITQFSYHQRRCIKSSQMSGQTHTKLLIYALIAPKHTPILRLFDQISIF